MQSPVLSMAENVRWTRSGVPWADFLLKGLDYGYKPNDDKVLVRSAHKMLFRALHGEALLLGVCAGLDSGAIVERMIRGVDLDVHPDWAAEAAATIDTLDEIEPGQRLYWLSIPLASGGALGQLKASTSAAMSSLTDTLGMPRTPVSDAEVQRRVLQAQAAVRPIPHEFDPQPATPAQMVWLHEHNLQRGLNLDQDLPADTELHQRKSSSALAVPMLDEGGRTDVPPTELKSWIPSTSRFLKIEQPSAVFPRPASYQVMLALADTPSAGVLFPGSEFLGLVDYLGVDVDWAMRMTVLGSTEVVAKNRRALINLNEQYSQREGEVSHGHTVLDRTANDLGEYAAHMEADQMEVEVQATFIFAVGGESAEEAQEAAGQLATLFESNGYKLVQPIGYQEELWWAMTPGVPATKVVTEFAQITSSHHLSAVVPCASTDLGDSTGPLLSLNISSGRIGVVHHDIAGKADRDISGSYAAVGELGSGKSVLLKTTGAAVVDRGGQVIAVDRTTKGEYAHWARSITDAEVVDVNDPQVSMDPLRMFGPTVGSRVLQSFLMPLLQIDPTHDLGMLMSDVCDPTYLQEHHLTSTGAWWEHLREGCTLDKAHDLWRMINVYARKDFGAVIFNGDLPPLTSAAPAIVIRTHTVQMPSQEQVENAHLAREMTLEQRYGRAIYRLIANVAREICFADEGRLGLFLLDECHHLTRSNEGALPIIDFLRDGRKHGAAVGLGSHDPEADFGNATLRGLIKTRFVMRHTDLELARRSLGFINLDPTDKALLKELMEQTSPTTGKDHYVEPHRRGEAFMMDGTARIGRIKVLLPSVPARALAVSTTPKSAVELNKSTAAA